MGDIDLAAILAVFAGMLAGFFALSKYMLGQSSSDREADRLERKEQNAAFVEALNKVAMTNQAIADATEKGNREAEKRNGHLAELTIQSKQDTLKAIGHLKIQHVDEQFVKDQHIEPKV